MGVVLSMTMDVSCKHGNFSDLTKIAIIATFDQTIIAIIATFDLTIIAIIAT